MIAAGLEVGFEEAPGLEVEEEPVAGTGTSMVAVAGIVAVADVEGIH